jgi:DNA-binding MarR family transcriptional regulator
VAAATIVDERDAAATARRPAVAAVREFGRFWARDVVCRLDGGLTGSTYSPAEARVIFDLGSGGPAELAGLRGSSGIDTGHLARIVHRLRNEGVVATTPSPGGPVVELTAHGQEVLVLDRQIAEYARSILAGWARTAATCGAMAMIRRALSVSGPSCSAIAAPGDPRWQRHAPSSGRARLGRRFEGEVGCSGSWQPAIPLERPDRCGRRPRRVCSACGRWCHRHRTAAAPPIAPQQRQKRRRRAPGRRVGATMRGSACCHDPARGWGRPAGRECAAFAHAGYAPPLRTEDVFASPAGSQGAGWTSACTVVTAAPCCPGLRPR